MRSRIFGIVASLALLAPISYRAEACTGISLRAADGAHVIARTIEWGGSKLLNDYVVVPRGHKYTSYTPMGQDGMSFSAKYGFVGVTIMDKNFVVDGINEQGLAAGLFYFPGYGEYPEYESSNNASTIADMQLVSWILSQFTTVEQVRAAIESIKVVSIAGSSTVHWRVADSTGAQIVIEYIDGEAKIYNNEVGVLTNSPSFDWQETNLNNYVNLYPGAATVKEYDGVALKPFGAGSGLLGLPGDMTPPSRFVRAFFLQTSAPERADGAASVLQAFQLLNSFDIPMGLIHNAEYEGQADIPSSTQWTAATDITNAKFYYRTMFNSAIRCIDLTQIDFSKAKFFSSPLDEQELTPIERVRVE